MSDAEHALPELLTVDDVAKWLRTTPKAIRLMKDRGQLPAPSKLGRRVLWRRDVLATWWERMESPTHGVSQR